VAHSRATADDDAMLKSREEAGLRVEERAELEREDGKLAKATEEGRAKTEMQESMKHEEEAKLKLEEEGRFKAEVERSLQRAHAAMDAAAATSGQIDRTTAIEAAFRALMAPPIQHVAHLPQLKGLAKRFADRVARFRKDLGAKRKETVTTLIKQKRSIKDNPKLGDWCIVAIDCDLRNHRIVHVGDLGHWLRNDSSGNAVIKWLEAGELRVPCDTLEKWIETQSIIIEPPEVRGWRESLVRLERFVNAINFIEEDLVNLSMLSSGCGDSGLDFLGALQQGCGPELCGITLQQLQDIPNGPKDTTRDIVEQHLKLRTAGKGVGYALLLNAVNPLRPRTVVCHAWDECYHELNDALQSSQQMEPFWLCSTAMYQNEDIPEVTIAKQLGPDHTRGPCPTVLRNAALMIGVVGQRHCLTSRMWCVFEMHMAVRQKVPIQMVQYVARYSAHGKEKEFGNIDTLPILEQALQPVNSLQARCGPARCTTNHDEKSIRKSIEAGVGFQMVDVEIEKVRFQALLDLPLPIPAGWQGTIRIIDIMIAQRAFDQKKHRAAQAILNRLPPAEAVGFDAMLQELLEEGEDDSEGADGDLFKQITPNSEQFRRLLNRRSK
jgi:hypothetical protein